jgi:H+-transporting ATPase
VAYDHVVPSKHPEKWNLRALWVISAVLALPALGSSLLLLWAALDSFADNSLFAKMGLPGVPYAKVITMMYLKISISDFLTLFAARTHNGLFFSMRPGYLLLGLATMALAISTIVATLWPDSFPDRTHTRGLVIQAREPIADPALAAKYAKGDTYKLWPLWVWVYCVVWFLVQDVLKLGAYAFMRKVNLFNINTAKYVNVREANAFNDRPLARASAGMVEAKVLDMKVANAQAGVAEAADRAGDPNLRRMSQDLGIMRNSVQLARASIGQAVARGPGTDVEAGLSDEMARMKDTIAQLERAAGAAPASEKAGIMAQLDEVRNAYQKMEKVNALARSGAA